MRRIAICLATAVTTLAATACASQLPENPVPRTPQAAKLAVTEVTNTLAHGWDVGFLPGGKLLVTQRPGKLALISGTTVTQPAADFSDVFVRGESGLMGLVVKPDFEKSRQFITCQAHKEGTKAVDIRLVTWKLSEDERTATKVGDLLTGLPVNPGGRHGGCRPTIAADGALLVGTGDTARATIAQDRHSLGGKILRIDVNTGKPLPDNPFISSTNPNEQRIYSYGHRNTQGVALRPGTGQVFTTEHGPDVDDELNPSVAGGNYGWDPSRGGTTPDGYDESVPMTDTTRFPDAIRPLWTTGKMTEAISGAAFLTGKIWGALEGRLAVVALKGQKMLLFSLDAAGQKVTEVTVPPELSAYGRLRAARSGPDGALYVTTSNGTGDKLLRVTPA
ncbi:PQQ-dependent sugar dehydrogenase [Amycolatopsis sp. CA-230715]|uniref:PQQ-dependent sugar dehydrogenase n=1 Tax=Amycolatopsis sp. CA-230715 TaxID=2745196 RepID=UPI001C032566|nr:PQQ-dependent sugar dehydrogenase [Amycolatopsis sp. CA-230715]QWF81980.1 Aldose sugar dehydrogenase YliI [Amycolatopsis sp. CA-230715]